MTSSNASAGAAPRRQLEPTHPCIRCGREGVPADAGLCELCNPLELSQPSATQMHGIAAVGILVFIAILAVAGRAVIAGTGPFPASVASVTPAAGGLAVTVAIENKGTRDAATTCRLTEVPLRIGGSSQTVQAPLVRAGETLEFTTLVTRFGTEPRSLAVECQAP